VQVRVRGDALPVVEGLERWITDGGVEVDPVSPASVARRMQWLAAAHGAEPSADALVAVVAGLGPIAESDPMWQHRRPEVAAEFLAGDDLEPLPAAARSAVIAALAAGRTAKEAMRVALSDDDDAEFAAMLLERSFVDARHELGVAQSIDGAAAAMGVDGRDPAIRNRLEALLRDALDPGVQETVPSITVAVTGEPVLDRALSRSVARNQLRTMALGLAAVLVLLVLLFGSVAAALTCVAPAVITALALGGVMGLLGVQMDLSTAMAGAILTDTASDFGMHYVWYLRQQPHEEVVRTVGPIMIVSNVLVALGFFAFAMGSSSVMHVFGSLSGATCVLSAIVACAIIPAVWKWIGPRKARAPS
jgi:MMPL family